MPRPKKPSAPTEDQVADLAEAVKTLTQQVQVLTDVLDMVREELQWALNNDRFRSRSQGAFRPAPFHLTSMPRDPCAPDFGERLNRFKPADLPPDEEPPTPEENSQRDLFSSRTHDGV